MAESEQVIHLTGTEDIHAVRRMVSRAKVERLLLVVPNQHPALQREIRMRLLARQAYAEQKKVAFVSRDSTVRDLAKEVNLSTFGSVEDALRNAKWREGQADKQLNGASHRNEEVLEWGRGRGAVAARQRALGTRSNWGEYVMLSGLITALLIVFLAVVILLLPSAQIVLVPRQEPLQVQFDLTVDLTARESNADQRVIPGEFVRQDVQGTFEIPTTGRRDVPSAVATGTVTFINITGQAITIPAGTIVSTSSGTPVRFRTTETVSIAAQFDALVDSPIEALNPGPSGNVGAQQVSRVEGAAASIVRVVNLQATQGGGVQSRAVVTSADRAQLSEQLRQQLLQRGREALAEAAESQGRVLIADSVTMEITAENFNGVVDQQLDVLRLDLRARVSGLAVPAPEVDRVARRILDENIPNGYRLLGNQNISIIPGEGRLVDEAYVLPVTVEGLVSAIITGDEVRAIVRGQPLDVAFEALLQRLPLEADPSITLSPDWWDRMPYLPIRIFITLGVLEREETAEPTE
jgi:hypothetical protein